MSWTHPAQLVRFANVLARAQTDLNLVSDEDLLREVRAAYWGTNCWSAAEMSFSIIAATCAVRPQLAVDLIADPIEMMIAGGLQDENDVIAQGVALAYKDDPYVPLTDAGRAWLLQSWPTLEDEVKTTFRKKRKELS